MNNLPSNWQIKSLGEIIDSLESGGRAKGGAVGSGTPSIGAEHLNDVGKFNFDSMKYVPTDYFNSMNKGKILKEDILIVKDGATTGKVSYVDEEFPFKESAVNEHVFIVRAKKEILNPQFAFYYLYSSNGNLQILKDFRGSAQGGISRDFVNKVQIPLPPLLIQKQIAGILEKADQAKQKRKEANTLTEQFLQSAFIEMFGDPMKNPKRWEIKTLEQVCNKITDGEHLNPSLSSIGKFMITAMDVKEEGVDFSRNNFVSEIDFIKFIKKCNPEKNDLLLVSRGATIGRCCLVDTEKQFCLMGSVILIKPKNVFSTYLLFLFRDKNYLKYILNLSPSSAQQAVYISNIKTLKLPLPPPFLQQQFAKLVQKTEALKEKQKQSGKELENLFNSLMQKGVKGELIY